MLACFAAGAILTERGEIVVSTERPQFVVVKRNLILNEAKELLVIKRAPDDRHNPNMVEFPGGKIEKGQTVDEAGDEEILQETGLIVKRIPGLSYVESLVLTSGPYIGATYIAIFGLARKIGGTLTLSNEHREGRWSTEGDILREPNLTSQSRNALIAFGGHVLEAAYRSTCDT